MSERNVYKVAVDAIRTALLEVASDDQIDPRYTLTVISRILHHLDNIVDLQDATSEDHVCPYCRPDLFN